MAKIMMTKKKAGCVAGLAATFLCSTAIAVTGIVGLPQSANAMTTVDNIRTVSELYNGDGTFRTENLTALYSAITGTANATYSAVNTAAASPITAATLNTRNGNKDIIVEFGGEKWTVTYVSKDTSGNVIATLWLADGGHSDLQPFSSGWYSAEEKTDSSGNIYYVTENLYPTNMYSSSYLRSYLNGTPYIQAEGAAAGKTTVSVTESQLSVNEQGAQADRWAYFTNGEITEYIVQPKNVSWQVTGQGDKTNYNWTWETNRTGDTFNSSIAPASMAYHNSDTLFNYLAKDSQRDDRMKYGSWGNDYLWIPSTIEVANQSTNTGAKTGLWKTTQSQLESDTGVSSGNLYTGEEGLPTGMNMAWLRSGQSDSCYRIHGIAVTGVVSDNYAYNCRAVRPALHLNLTKAEQNKRNISSNQDLQTAWVNAVQESLDNNGKQVKFTLTHDWIANTDLANITSFGTNATGFNHGRLLVPYGANILLDLNGYTLDRNLKEVLNSYGSAVRVYGELTVEDSSAKQTGKITGGFADNAGGGIFVGGPNEIPAKLTINGGSIVGNRVEGPTRDESVTNLRGYGGGIFAYLNSSVTINGGVIKDNYCGGDGNGGGVYVDSASLTINGGEISNNTSTGMGGGIYAGNTDVVINGGVVSCNTSSMGGGVAILGTSTTNDDGTLTKDRVSTLKIFGGEISGNVATGSATADVSGHVLSAGQGGGIVASVAEITINGGVISGNNNNIAGAKHGGGIYGIYSDITMNAGEILNNITQHGGGICISTSTLIMNGGTIAGNYAIAGNSGGVHAIAKSTLIINNGSIINNTAGGNGGATYQSGTGEEQGDTIVINGGLISGNTAERGGGIYTNSYSNLTINGGIITGNTSRTYGGGVIVASGSSLTMTDGEISNNTATTYGGGVLLYRNSAPAVEFVMEGGIISGNTANTDGAGVYLLGHATHGGAVMTMNGGEIVHNNALNGGGGVAVTARCSFTMNGGKINYNESDTDWGAGVYMHGGSNANRETCIFTMNGGEIRGNKTYRDWGSGVGVVYAVFNLNNGVITENYAAYGGAGVHLHWSIFNLGGGMIYGNTRNDGLASNVNQYALNADNDWDFITVTRDLSTVPTYIGVNVGTSEESTTTANFTKDYGKYNNGVSIRNYFFSDRSNRRISYTGSGTNAEGCFVDISNTDVFKEVTWQYSTNGGVSYTDIEGGYLSVPYTGTTYKIRAWDKAANAAITNWVANAGDVTTPGTYGYSVSVMSEPIYTNNVLRLDIVKSELTWQYATSTNGTSWGDWLPFKENMIDYTGLYYRFRAVNASGAEVPLASSSSGNAKNTGDYTYKADDINGYYENTGISFKINVRYITINWEFQNASGSAGNYFWDYDGLAHTPVAVMKNLAENQIANLFLTFSYTRRGISGTATAASANAGNWQVVASLRTPDENIILTGTTTYYTIRALTVSAAFAGGNTQSGEYDGERHTVSASLNGLISSDIGKVSPVITYYEDGVALTGAPVNAGNYTVTATLPENGNYVLNGEYTATLEITQLGVTVNWTGNVLNNGAMSWTFDGTAKRPTAVARNPLASGNLALTVDYAVVTGGVAGAYSDSLERINAGTYSMRVTLANADQARNYKLLDTVKEFTIAKRDVTVSWVDGDGNTVTPDANDIVVWQYDGTAHTVMPRVFANGVEVDGVVGVELAAERTDVNANNTLTDAVSSPVNATARLVTTGEDGAFNANFNIIGSSSIRYQVVKRELTSANWLDKSDLAYVTISEISYPYGSIVGAAGPGFHTVTAAGIGGALSLGTVSYNAAYTDETPWAVDTVDGYIAYASLSDNDWINYTFVGDAVYNGDGRTTFVKFFIRPASASRVEVDVVWALFAEGDYPTAAVGEQVNATARPYQRFRDTITADFEAEAGEARFTFTYNGKLQRPYAVRELFDENNVYVGYEILATTVMNSVNAGQYVMSVLAASGNNNYAYSGRMECSYDIIPADITVEWDKAANYYFTGAEQGPVAKITDGKGNVLFTYGDEEGNIYGLEVSLGRNAGLHTAKASVNGNYNIVSGAQESYLIQKRAINAASLTWSIDNNSSWTMGEEKEITASYVYENENTGYSYEIKFVITGTGTVVGKYVAVAYLDSSIDEHDNFTISGSATRSYEIVPVRTGTVYWVKDKNSVYSSDPIIYIYDGNVHSPSAYYFPDGADTSDLAARVWLDEYIDTTPMPDVGTRIARLVGDLDFSGAQTTCEFTIKPLEIIVEWIDNSLSVEFDGDAHSPEVKPLIGAQNYELVLGTDYEITSYTEANTYTARLNFLNHNYTYATQDADGNAIDNTCQFTVRKADLSGIITWDYASAGASGSVADGYYWQYDEQSHAPVAVLTGVTLNGSPVAFTFDYSGIAASAGVHTVRAQIASAICDGVDVTRNYTVGEAAEQYEIKAYEIEVIWNFAGASGSAADGYYWFYDGQSHAPTASYISWNGAKTLVVYGAARNASDTKYVAKVTLPDNCVFAAGETGTHEFEIRRANINVEWRGDEKAEYIYDKDDFGNDLSTGAWYWVYDGAEHAPTPYIADTNTRLDVTGLQVNAGTYTATAAQGNANYVIETGGEIRFVISPRQVYIKWFGENGSETDFDYEYTGSAVDIVPTAKLVDENGDAILIDGIEAVVTVRGVASTMGTHTATAENTFTNYAFADDAKIEIQFKISAIDLSKFGFEWRNEDNAATVTQDDDGYYVYTYEFNGRAQAPVPHVTLANEFNVTIYAGTPGNAQGQVQAITEVGVYFISASYFNPNYKIPDDQAVIKVVITSRKVDVEWSEDKLVYNGLAQAPAAYYTDAFGEKVELSVSGTAVNAGENYTATADFRSATANYELNAETVEKIFAIEKKTLSVEWQWSSEWSGKRVTYDGLYHVPTARVSGNDIFQNDINNLTVYFELSKDGTVLRDVNGLIKTVKDAGEYKMTLKLDGSAAGNYQLESGKGETDFTIAKRALIVTAQDMQVNYGSNAPDYGVTFNGFAAVEADAETARALASKRLWLTCPYTNRTVPGPAADGSNIADYTISFVETRLNALLPNYDIAYVTGIITVNPVLGAVVWSGELDDLGAEYDGEEYKPTAYYFTTNGGMEVLDVFYATYDAATGTYTRNDNASPAINAGTYYVIAVARNGNVTLTGAETSYEIHKREITIKIDSKTSVYGDSAKMLTWNYATNKRPVGTDDLGIVLSCEINDETTFTGGFKDVGVYFISGRWDVDTFGGNYNVVFVGEGEAEGTGDYIYGLYEITEAKIIITKAQETYSGEEFESVQSLDNNSEGWEILLAKVDENGKPVYVNYAGNQDAEIRIWYSRRHSIGEVGNLIDPPDPHDRSEEVNRYRESVDLIRDTGCYAINYIIEIPNHETLYGTWRILMLPESRVVRITFVGDYESEYGTEVPEDLATQLLTRGLIQLKNISQSDFRQNATARVVNGAQSVNGRTNVGRYTIEIELANNDDNVERIVSYHSDFGAEDTNVGRFRIVPKELDIEWGNLNYTHDEEKHVPTPIMSGWVTRDSFTLPDIKVNGSGGLENTAYTVEDNGNVITVVVTANGNFTTTGGHTLRVMVESSNYRIADDKDVGTVSITAADIVNTQDVLPEWVLYVGIGVGLLLLILLIIIFVLSRRKGEPRRESAGGGYYYDDDDGFMDDYTDYRDEY